MVHSSKEFIRIDASSIIDDDDILLYNWSVEGFPSQYYNTFTTPVVFGPFTNPGYFKVSENVTNRTGGTTSVVKQFLLKDSRDYIVGNYSYKADYANRSAEYPNGTLTFRDVSRISPPPEFVSGWWWKVVGESGSRTFSGKDRITMNLVKGTYKVDVTIQSSLGNIISYNGSTPGNPDYHPPVSNFTVVYRNGNSPMNVAFIDQSTALTPLTYSWDFDDGSDPSSERNPEHTYVYRDTPYSPTLTVTDLFGTRVVSDPYNIQVDPSPSAEAPVAQFSFTTTDRKVQFIDHTLNKPVFWQWNFGDGSTSNEMNPAHTYSLFGTYPVSLTVSNAAGTSETTQKLTISGSSTPVKAGFTVLKTGFRTYKFTDTSSGPILNWILDFADKTSSRHDTAGWSEYHTFEKFGHYPVTLRVTNGGHSDTETKRIFIT